jgi:cytochrome c oxidase assembly protein subunit 15
MHMTWTFYQRLAVATFIAVEVLIFVGAAVRASGSGLGCPDWPFCYGCWLPPTKAEDIDFSRLDLEKFRKKAAQHGRDPATITEESLRAEFDPMATWIEYLNRLTSLPVGFTSLLLFLASFGQIRQRRMGVFLAGLGAFALVLLNAWLGAKVVLSGLQPGIITLHMALAILLQCVLVYAAWGATETRWRLKATERMTSGLRILGWLLFLLIVIEGVMGSQVRELTDALAKTHVGELRSQWVGELEQSWVYLMHRSFSWLIVGCALWWMWKAGSVLKKLGWLEWGVVGIVFAQMFLGLILAHVGIVRVAQVLHIGLSSLLVSGLFLWLLGASKGSPKGAVTDAGGVSAPTR